jgi:hypothetical protein
LIVRMPLAAVEPSRGVVAGIVVDASPGCGVPASGTGVGIELMSVAMGRLGRLIERSERA